MPAICRGVLSAPRFLGGSMAKNTAKKNLYLKEYYKKNKNRPCYRLSNLRKRKVTK